MFKVTEIYETKPRRDFSELSHQYKGSCITYENLRRREPKFCGWFEKALPISRKEMKDYVLIFKLNSKEIRYRVCIFNENYSISITIVPNKYIGGSLSTRKYLVGERHNRGRDLIDGKFNEKTVKKLVDQIFKNSLCKLEV